MKSIAVLMIIASLTSLAGMVALGIALSLAAAGGAGPLWVATVACLLVAGGSVAGVRALNRRNGTGYTLFTI